MSDTSDTGDDGVVTITVNGDEIQAPAGQMLIEAAENGGEYIPRFCWHKRLRPVAICRMCLVEVEGMRGLQPSCYTPVKDGMVVNTQSDEVVKAQEGVLEFLLANHPLDCPVCDRGGECPLQDHTMSFGPGESRFVEEKRHFEKPIPVSDLVLLDRERCIQCSRCVRVADEVAGDALLDFAKRGNQLHIMTFPDEPFSSYFSGNTVQVCPVGALTAEPYRFKARPWDVTAGETTCTGCAVGCRGALYETRNEPVRLLGVDTDSVGWGWLCDKGRFGYEYLAADDRLRVPLEHTGKSRHEITWAAAVERTAQKIKHASGRIAAIGGARLSNEEAYALSKFMRTVCGTNDLDCQLGDGLPAPFVVGCENRAQISDVDNAAAVVLMAPDLKEELPVFYLRVRDAAANRGVPVFVAGGQQSGLSQFCTQRVDSPREVADLDLPDAGEIVVVAGRQSLTQDPGEIVRAATELAGKLGGRIKLMPVLRRANAHGALDMGVSPQLLPGRVAIDDPAAREKIAEIWNGEFPPDPGLDTQGILEAAADGDVEVLFVVGADPVSDFVDPDLARRALETCEHVVVSDLFMTPTGEFADIVIPAAGWGEVDGTVTNIEGRVQTVTARIVPPGQAASDAQLFREIAEYLGIDFGCGTPQAILAEINRVAPAYSDVRTSALRGKAGKEGIVVGATSVDPTLGSGGDPEPVSASARPPGSLRLRVSRTLYDLGTLVVHSPSLAGLRPGPEVRLNPEDLDSRGIDPGASVRVRSTNGDGLDIERSARADREVPRGELLLPHAQSEPERYAPATFVTVEAT